MLIRQITLSTGKTDRAVEGVEIEAGFLERAFERISAAQLDDVEQIAAKHLDIPDEILRRPKISR